MEIALITAAVVLMVSMVSMIIIPIMAKRKHDPAHTALLLALSASMRANPGQWVRGVFGHRNVEFSALVDHDGDMTVSGVSYNEASSRARKEWTKALKARDDATKRMKSDDAFKNAKAIIEKIERSLT